jgi:hypothetical protein
LVACNTKRADDSWFTGLNVILWYAEPVFLVEREDEGDELFITDTGAEFAVEQVASGFG